MNDADPGVDKQKARPCEINVEAPEKPRESLTAEETQRAVNAVEQPEAVQAQHDEKLNLWMKNIKEFIRDIDVKSL